MWLMRCRVLQEYDVSKVMMQELHRRIAGHVRAVAPYMAAASVPQMFVVLGQAIRQWQEELCGTVPAVDEKLALLLATVTAWVADPLPTPCAGDQVAEQLLVVEAMLLGRGDDFLADIKRRKKIAKKGTVFGAPTKAQRDAGYRFHMEMPAVPPRIKGVHIAVLMSGVAGPAPQYQATQLPPPSGVGEGLGAPSYVSGGGGFRGGRGGHRGGFRGGRGGFRGGHGGSFVPQMSMLPSPEGWGAP